MNNTAFICLCLKRYDWFRSSYIAIWSICLITFTSLHDLVAKATEILQQQAIWTSVILALGV